MADLQQHVWISGRVQGVSFRYYTQEQAKRLQLRGWVRNLYDGRVEAVFCGNAGDVARMLAWCERGPSSAYVESVEAVEEPPQVFSDFQIRTTARGL